MVARYYQKISTDSNSIPEDDDESGEDNSESDEAPIVKPKYNFTLDPPWNVSNSQREDLSQTTLKDLPHSNLHEYGKSTAPGSRGSTIKVNAQGKDDTAEKRHVMMIDQLWLWILDES